MKQKFDAGKLYVYDTSSFKNVKLTKSKLEKDQRSEIIVFTKNADGSFTNAGTVKKTDLE